MNELNSFSSGYVPSENDYYCSPAYPTTLRQVPGISCCAPQSPDEIGVRFRLFQPGKGEVGDLDWRVGTIDSKLGQGRVNFVAHGYLENYQASPWMPQLVEAYNNVRGEQVVVVDWHHGNQFQFFQSAANIRTVAKMIGRMVNQWKASAYNHAIPSVIFADCRPHNVYGLFTRRPNDR